MKPIKIVMSAFGPYADRREIAMDALGGQGLFLITGDTGAGKTTIFDAVAFALFGEASGSTRTVDTLRSDFAKAETKTFVELTFFHKNEIYKILRNPRYQRPKKNKEGFTTENADAVLNLPNGDVVTGYKDVSAKIVDLLGITYRQYKQIAMIAQGEFLQLLLSDSKERGEIFRRVFGTQMYQYVQQLLKEREREAKKRCENGEQSIVHYISGIACPLDEQGQELSAKLKQANIYNAEECYIALEQLVQEDSRQKEVLQQKSNKLQLELNQQLEVLTQAQYINQYFADMELAKDKKNQLALNLDTHNDRMKKLHQGEKALSILPLEMAYKREKDIKKKLEESLFALHEQIQRQSQQLKTAKLIYDDELEKEPRREQLSSGIDRLTNLLPQYEYAQKLKYQLNQLFMKKTDNLTTLETLCKEKSQLIQEKKKQMEELELLQGVEVDITVCEQEKKQILFEQTQLKELSSSYYRLIKMEQEQEQLKQEFYQSQDILQQEEKTFQDKEMRFYQEQAGLLAENLKEGVPCPVCGSTHHPCKAKASMEAPSEAELQRLKKRMQAAHENMEKSSKAAGMKLAEVTLTKEQLQKKAEEIFTHIEKKYILKDLSEHISCVLLVNQQKQKENETLLIRLKENLSRKKAIKQQLDIFEEHLQKIEEESIYQEREKERILSELASKSGELKNIQSSLEYDEKQKAEDAIQSLKNDLKGLKDALRQAEDDYHTLRNQLAGNERLFCDQKERLNEVALQKEQAEKDYFTKLNEQTFSDEAAYHNALMSEEEIKILQGIILQYESDLKEVEREICRLSQEINGKEKLDMSQLELKKQKLEAEKKQVEISIQEVLVRLGINEPLKYTLEKAILDNIMYQKDYLQVSNLSKTANGELAGKQKLAFEQYVQAFYFNRILIEANKRLKGMTNHRYELLRREDVTNLRSQTGLEMDVMDHYTGRVRSVNSLSGGESFKASLSLALGLSDVIQSYAGGVEIDTLFIDEGFGALDAESLEQAIQTLAGLASGNRLVGIISHVSELKERIDRQIVIRKTSNGSDIRMIV